MGLETFISGNHPRLPGHRRIACLGHVGHRRPLHEIVHREGGEGLGPSARWQHVAWPDDEIAQCRRRVLAKQHFAGVPDHPEIGEGIA